MIKLRIVKKKFRHHVNKHIVYYNSEAMFRPPHKPFAEPS